MAHQREAISELLKRTEATIGNYKSSYAQALLSDQRKLFNAVDGIVSMRNTPNSLITPAAHALKIYESANRLKNESNKVKDRALNTYMQYSVDIDNSINQLAGIKEDQYASEVRTAFRSMPTESRMDFIKGIIDSKDGATFAAIMFAPEILTGVSVEMRNILTESFHLKVAPELHQEKEDLKAAMDAIEASIRTATGLCSEYNNPDEVRKIELEVQQAQEATSKFNEAMG